MIKVFVANVHEPCRTGVRNLLEPIEDMQVVGVTENCRELLSLCRELKPDVILLDLHMIDMDSLEDAKQIQTSNQGIRFLILTKYENEEYASLAINADTCGFVNKRISTDELPDMIRRAYNGDIYMTIATMEILASRKMWESL